MAEKKTAAVSTGYKPRLLETYRNKVFGELKTEFAYKSVMQVPNLEKIVISMGLGEAITNKKLVESAIKELGQITGQKAVKTKSRKAVSNFKLRENMEIGAMVTLRGQRMWEFMDRLISLALPRVKDFRGLNPNAFDGRGNYSMGITEQIIFPEIDIDKVEKIGGMNIAIVTTAKNDIEGRSLLRRLGMPFKK